MAETTGVSSSKTNVIYKEGSNVITVTEPKTGNVVVYAHPADNVLLSFDIGALRKELVNGDLVIHTLSGKTVTFANYSIMFMQNDLPNIVDSQGRRYNYNDFLSDVRLTNSTDGATPYIIDRVISTPDSQSVGDYLASGEGKVSAGDDGKDLTGNLEVEEQNPSILSNTFFKPFEVKTFFQPSATKYAIEVNFHYTGRTMKQDEEDSVKPIVVKRVNPSVAPLYGTEMVVSDQPIQGKQVVVNAKAGGGEWVGNDYAKYQYEAEVIDYSSSAEGMYYGAYTGNTIERGLSISITDASSTMQQVTLTDIPEGVTIQGTENTTVQDLNNGTYIITPKAASDKIDVVISYEVGMEAVFSNVGISIVGYNYKYDRFVIGDADFGLDFRAVDGPEDIMNFSAFNTFTFSTNIDPLHVILTDFDDVVVGGVANNHTYETLDGNDSFYSGSGKEQVDLGGGDDWYYVGTGSDIVQGGLDVDSISFQHDMFTNEDGDYTFNTDVTVTLDGGAVNIYNALDGSNSSYKGFEKLYLEDAQYTSSLNQDNIVYINSTQGLDSSSVIGVGELAIYSGDGAGDTIVLNNAGLIDVTQASGVYITTVKNSDGTFNKSHYVNIAPEEGANHFSIVRGSSSNDIILGGDRAAAAITFYAGAGFDTADYSATTQGFTYYAVDTASVDAGTVQLGERLDRVLEIEKIVGGTGLDTFYASGTDSMEYWGSADGLVRNGDTVSYETETENGVTIDFNSINTKGYVEVTKSDGGIDKLYYIDVVIASQAGDTFIVSDNSSSSFDGLLGEDTLDASNTVNPLTVTVTDASGGGVGGSGNIYKGGVSDTFESIEIIKGSGVNDTFNITGIQTGSMTYDGGAGVDTIDYSGVAPDVSLYLNITTGVAEKRIEGNSNSVAETILNFETIIATSNDDEFEVEGEILDAGRYDGGSQTSDLSQDVTEVNGHLVNAGDVLYYNWDSGEDILMSTISNNFANMETLRLGDFDNTVVYQAGVVVNIYGGSGDDVNGVHDTFDASLTNTRLVFNVTGSKASETSITLYEFEEIIGGIQNDIFNVNVSADIDNHDYRFDGGMGVNTLDYSGVAGGVSDANLKFDLSQGTVQKDYDPNNPSGAGSLGTDYFTNISSFKGGDGDDYFIVDPADPSKKIDGGGGTRDVVSFENYVVPVTSTDVNPDQYIDIEAFVLTDFNDSWDIFDTTENSDIEGGVGLDTLNFQGSGALVFNVVNDADLGDSIYMVTAGGNTHRVNKFEIFRGTTGDDTVNMSLTNNSALSSTGDLYFFLEGGNNKADYSSVTPISNEGVVMRVGFNNNTIANGTDKDTDIIIEKDDDGTGDAYADYYAGVRDFVLTSGNDIVIINDQKLEDFININIDMGAGTDTIDISLSINNIIFDMATTEINGYKYNITNWENFKSGSGDDEVTFDSNVSPDVGIDLGAGSDAVIFINLSNSIIVSSSDNGDIFVEYGTNQTVTLRNVEEIEGTDQDDIFIGNNFGSYTFDGAGGDTGGDTLSYATATAKLGYIFNLSNPNSATVIKDQASGYIDTIAGFENIEGTSANDVFNIDVTSGSSTYKSLDGGDGRDTLNVTAGAGSTLGFVLNDAGGYLEINGTTAIDNIASFEVLKGGSGADVFDISSTSFLTEQGSIDGADGTNDVANLGFVNPNSDMGLYVDVSSGRYYVRDNSQSGYINNQYLTVKNVENVTLTDEDDVLVFTGSSSSNLQIDMGGDVNGDLISLTNYGSAQNGTIAEITAGLNLSGVTGYEGLVLTKYTDSLEIVSTDEPGLSVDGNIGIDTISYNENGVDVYNDSDTAITTVDRHTGVDTVNNFEIFKLGDVTADNVYAGKSGFYTFYADGGNGDNNTEDKLSYETSTDIRVVVNFATNTVYKVNNSSGVVTGIDTVYEFNQFVGTAYNDVVYVNDSITNVNGNGGTDTLYLTYLTAGVTFNSNTDGSATIEGTNIKINVVGTSFSKIIGTGYNDTFNVSIAGKTYDGAGGVNTLSYSTSSVGVIVDVTAKTVKSTDIANTTVDKFNNMSFFVGSTHDDTFQGLNSYQSFTIDGGAGFDTVSYSASLTAINITVDASGNISIDKSGQQDNLTNIEIVEASAGDDTATVDVAALDDAGKGISGGDGYDILTFTGATTGIDFIINQETAGTGLEITEFEEYVLTNQDDTVTYNYRDNDVIKIDFAGTTTGQDEFLFSGVVTGSMLISVNALSDDMMMFVGSTTISLSHLDSLKLNFLSGSDVSDLTIALNDYNFDEEYPIVISITDDSDIDWNKVSVNVNNYSNLMQVNIGGGVSFNGVSNSPVLGARTWNFLNPVNSAQVVEVSVAALNANYSVSIQSAVTINFLTSFSSTVFNGKTLTVTETDGNTAQITSNNIANSTLKMSNGQALQVSANTTINMFGHIQGNGLNSNSVVDFSGYTGAHGDWVVLGTATTGSFANDFDVAGVNSIIFTGTADNVTIKSGSVSHSTLGYFDSGNGYDTVVIDYDSAYRVESIGYGTGDRVDFANGNNFYIFYSTEVLDISNANLDTTTGEYSKQNVDGDEQTVFTMNEQLDIETLIMPYATTASYGGTTMPDNRVVLDNGNAPSSNITVSFGTTDTGIDNRMMQTNIEFIGNTETKIMDIQNVRYIKTDNGSDTIIFSPLSTVQYVDLAHQLSNDVAYQMGASLNTFLEIDAGGVDDGSSNDIIDLSSWNIDPYVGYVSNSGIRFQFMMTVDSSHNLIMGRQHAGGTLTSVANLDAMLAVKLWGAETIILPHTTVGFIINDSSFASAASQGETVFSFQEDTNENNYATAYFTSSNPYVTDILADSLGTTVIGKNGVQGASLQGFTNFELQGFNDGVSTPQANVITIGANVATGGLYMSNKVQINADQAGSGVYTDEVDPTKPNSQDSVDFSGITTGSYYFSFGNWTYQGSATFTSNEDTHGFVPEPTGDRNTTPEYQAWLASGDQVGGIFFTQESEASKIGKTDGYDSELFYRLTAFNYITLTSSKDTFSTGKVFSDPVTGGVYGPSVLGGSKQLRTFEINASAGFDTLLDESFTAENTGEQGAAQTGALNYITLGGTTYDRLKYNVEGGVAGSNGNGFGHIQRLWDVTYTGEVSNIKLHVNGTIVDIINGNNWSNYRFLYDYDYTYSGGTVQMQFNGFESIVIDDYTDDYQTTSSTGAGYYFGVQDDVTIKGSAMPSYFEVDLGGRYVDNAPNGTVQQQHVLYEASGEYLRISWNTLNNDPKVDSWLIIQDGSSATTYESAVSVKNFDYIDLAANGGVDGGLQQIDFVFNTDMNFESLNGKKFYLDMYSSNATNVNILYNNEMYNYDISTNGYVEGSGNDYLLLTVYNDDHTMSFNFQMYVGNDTNVQIDDNASKEEMDAYSSQIEDDKQEAMSQDSIDDQIDADATSDSNSTSEGISTFTSPLTVNPHLVSALHSAADRVVDFANNHEVITDLVAGKLEDGLNNGFGDGVIINKVEATVDLYNDIKEGIENNTIFDGFVAKHLDSNTLDIVQNNLQDIANNVQEKVEDKVDALQDSLADKLSGLLDNSNADLQKLGDINLDKLSLDNLNFGDNIKSAVADKIGDKADGVKYSYSLDSNLEGNLDMSALFDKAGELLDNSSADIKESLIDMVQNANSVDEANIQDTNKLDEADSMSFALDSMFSSGGEDSVLHTASDANQHKSKNSSNNGHSNT